MSDDDSLVDLDELDRILKDAGSSKEVKSSNEWNTCSQKPSLKKSRADKSIDDFLKEFSDDDNEDWKSSSKVNSFKKNKESSASATKKCSPFVYISASDPEGLTKPSQVMSCDRLRCFSCDFDVVGFRGYRWTSDTDYLFLRNNHPLKEKLKANLVVDPSSSAFCCQCESISISKRTKLDSTSLSWSCRSH
ncbi:unnamed protein product [Oikopleura dioica]|uniref:Cilia- and flagella-associated protein 418 n=1 Tax=Oikopleura dioica TaxID=34765 RepID=E4X424_OIKDI|nr:unnamed protein product [Oikopleura dioica]